MVEASLDETLDTARAIVAELRSRGLRDEADILGRALDVASAAVTGNGEVYCHALIDLHDLTGDRLDELERETEGASSPS